MNRFLYTPKPGAAPKTAPPAALPDAPSPAFAARLSVPPREQNEEQSAPPLTPAMAQLFAFKQLVSASCYLSLSPTTEHEATLEATLEAIQILHDCSQELLREGVDLGSRPAEMEDLIWSDRQSRWERRFASGAKAEPVPGAVGARRSRAQQDGRSLRPLHMAELAGNSTQGAKNYCSHCNDYSLRRTERRGFWMRVVLSRLGLFPWECAYCRDVVMLRQRAPVANPQTRPVINLPWSFDMPVSSRYLTASHKSRR